MSSILGVFGSGHPPADQVVHRMLSKMGAGETDRRTIWRGRGALLSVARPEWQMGPRMGDGELVVTSGSLAVAADASVYYRTELKRALQREGVVPKPDGPGSLILAAYLAWGDACVDHLEGDWAFILWDARGNSVLCARDFGGKRTLHYAHLGETLVVATTISGVLAYPDCPANLNVTSIGETVAGFHGSSHETCYSAVRRLHAGHTLQWHAGRSSTRRFWNPCPREDPEGLPFEDAARHLRGLLGRAVEERLSPAGTTSLQLSGGWDSPSIFAVGQDLFRRGAHGGAFAPVSISYPKGDPGREDDIIEMITRYWNVSTHWLDIAEIPLFDAAEAAAAERDEPFVHVYEHWNRRLVHAGRARGSRVMLDGFGGDSLFQSSPVFLADLLRTGRIVELRRELISKRMADPASFFRWSVLPLLPASVRRVLPRIPGAGSFTPHLERQLPGWMQRRFVREHGLVARERRATPALSSGPQAGRELYWHLTNPWMTRMLAQNYEFGMAAGVEVRSPLFDRRIVDFALTRPWSERSHRRQTKRLLRASVAGLLPDDVLAPRRYRTGMTTGFFQQRMRAALPRFSEGILRDPVLAELGIVDPVPLRQAIDSFVAGGDVGTGVLLYFTVQAELWLRARTSTAEGYGASAGRPASVGAG